MHTGKQVLTNYTISSPAELKVINSFNPNQWLLAVAVFIINTWTAVQLDSWHHQTGHLPVERSARQLGTSATWTSGSKYHSVVSCMSTIHPVFDSVRKGCHSLWHKTAITVTNVWTVTCLLVLLMQETS